MANLEVGDVLYDYANEVFDEVVFGGPEGDRLLEKYNLRDDDDATEALFDIVRDAEIVAKEAVKEAVYDCIESNRQWFIELLAGKE